MMEIKTITLAQARIMYARNPSCLDTLKALGFTKDMVDQLPTYAEIKENFDLVERNEIFDSIEKIATAFWVIAYALNESNYNPIKSPIHHNVRLSNHEGLIYNCVRGEHPLSGASFDSDTKAMKAIMIVAEDSKLSKHMDIIKQAITK